jgi:hypothetical protein
VNEGTKKHAYLVQMANVGKALQEATGLVEVAEQRRSLEHSNLFALCKLAIMQHSVGAVRVGQAAFDWVGQAAFASDYWLSLGIPLSPRCRCCV